MPEGWRIVKERHAATAFSGEGAAKTGGRWNSRGVPVVYTSCTKALAALESLVHLNPPVLFKYVAFRIKFDAALVEIFPAKALPAGWQTEPPPPSTKAIGDAWVRESRSAGRGSKSREPRSRRRSTSSSFPSEPSYRRRERPVWH